MRTLANDAMQPVRASLLYVSREDQTRKRVRKKKRAGAGERKGPGRGFPSCLSAAIARFYGGRVKIAGKLGSAPVCLACIAGVKRRQRKERKDRELER